MAIKDKNTIIGKLNGKKLELEADVTIKKDDAQFHRDEAKAAELGAALSEKQAVAVAQALAILTEAGVQV